MKEHAAWPVVFQMYVFYVRVLLSQTYLSLADIQKQDRCISRLIEIMSFCEAKHE